MAMPDKMTARYFSGYGFEAPVIIDVGVLGGTPFLYDSFPNAKFLLIDALEESEDAVRETWGDTLDFEFVNAALGATAGRVPIAIEPERPSRTSLSARADLSEDHFERDVPMLPLDQITDGRNGPFGLKIDTEGHELEVLKGATATLERCEFVIAEVSIKKRFAQGYRFSDVINFMADHGFEVHSFLSGLTRAPRMSDVLFLPADSPRFDMKTEDEVTR